MLLNELIDLIERPVPKSVAGPPQRSAMRIRSGAI